MQDINIKFKDSPPSDTVAYIQKILDDLGIRVTEQWSDSGIDNCWSLRLSADGMPSLASNGKGISRELAQASAYGEFIERIQCGLMLYKYQSVPRDPKLYMQSNAPDGKFVTTQELIDDGEWMDFLIRSYGGDLTREKIAQLCRVYACADEDAVWVIPFYSLFEDKYVYLPAAFLEQVYLTNGCCAGNTREEAWVHALSEIMERHCTISMVANNLSAPKIPEATIRQFPVAAKILDAIRATGTLDVDILDFSQGYNFPVIATRVVDKESHNYRLNVCADPILEIAIDRTLTETFQGHTIKDVAIAPHPAITSEELPNFPTTHNIFNQLERSCGIYPTDFFVDDTVCQQLCPGFTDRNATNKDLLDYVLGIYKELNYPIYIRNYSFLGFHCYYVVVPGFSEARGYDILSPINEYALGDSVYSAFRNPEKANNMDFLTLQTLTKRVSTLYSRLNNFAFFSGLPMDSQNHLLLTSVTLAYSAYRMGKFAQASDYLRPLFTSSFIAPEDREYFKCVAHYCRLHGKQVPETKISSLLKMLYMPASTEKLFDALQTCNNPFHGYLLNCDQTNCDQCRYRQHCAYPEICATFETVGQRYRNFTNGQARENFLLK